MVFQNEMVIWMGKLEVRIIHAGAEHTERNLPANPSRTRPKIRRFPHLRALHAIRRIARLYNAMTMRPKASNIRASGIWTAKRARDMRKATGD